MGAYEGGGVRLIAVGTQNGAALVARRGKASLEGLRGYSLSTSQLGGTQDVALKTLLQQHGRPTGTASDQVEVLRMVNSQTRDQFKQGRLDAS